MKRLPDATSDYLNRAPRTLAEVEAKRLVVCGAVPSFDGWTGERIGWFYGIHFINRMPADGKCPRCGISLL